MCAPECLVWGGMEGDVCGYISARKGLVTWAVSRNTVISCLRFGFPVPKHHVLPGGGAQGGYVFP